MHQRPISVHVEYMRGKPWDEIAAAMSRDLATLGKLLW